LRKKCESIQGIRIAHEIATAGSRLFAGSKKLLTKLKKARMDRAILADRE